MLAFVGWIASDLILPLKLLGPVDVQRLQKNAENLSLLSSYIEKNADDYNRLSHAVDLLNEVIEQINSLEHVRRKWVRQASLVIVAFLTVQFLLTALRDCY